MVTISPARPSWQRGPVFKFFASLKLAVVLLAVLIVAAIAGTIWESSFDAKVARAYVYRAPWFNLWLVLLAANLTVSALSRWPWRKHHVAFLVTHLGIITLLAGSLIGRIFGIEGTITLFKGAPLSNRLLIDEHQLRVHDSDGVLKGYRAEFLHRPPTPQHPRDLGRLASGARLSVIDYAEAIDAKLNPRPLDSGGMPALHFTIKTAMMGQQLESWLLADNAQNGNFAMGLANIELKRGKAPTGDGHPDQSEAKSRDPEEVPFKVTQRDPSVRAGLAGSLGMTDLEESIFVFAKMPDQISHVAKGGATGAKISFSPPQAGDKGQLTISLAGKTQTLDVAQNLKKDVAIAGTSFTVRIENYWADLRIQDGKPASLSDSPNNPAVVITIRGRGVPIAAAAANAHGNEQAVSTNGGPSTIPNIAPAMDEANAAENHLTLFVAEDGAISCELDSRKIGHSSGPLELNKPLVTGWADWQLVVDRILPHAEQWMDFTPAKNDGANQLPDGVRVRVEQNGESFEQWISAGWQVTVPTLPNPIGISYGWRSTPLPIALELLDFEVTRNEGNDAPAGFKSTLRVSTAEGDSATGQCWMNHPFSFPGSWWRTWSGLTFKMSQASWNPENLGQSTIQILRDPGWLLKWIGSLLVVTGVFLLFYVKKFRRQYATAKTKRIVAPSPAPEAREVVVS
ncbi:MAG: hypothetical protein DMF19_07010 [Verrucomicrobia bacterium]|nr:MAG: hypothetical protein DMF19_07010 [Verrucomicrobiota bacterium]